MNDPDEDSEEEFVEDIDRTRFNTGLNRKEWHVIWASGKETWEPADSFLDEDGTYTNLFLAFEQIERDEDTEEYEGANPILLFNLIFTENEDVIIEEPPKKRATRSHTNSSRQHSESADDIEEPPKKKVKMNSTQSTQQQKSNNQNNQVPNNQVPNNQVPKNIAPKPDEHFLEEKPLPVTGYRCMKCHNYNRISNSPRNYSCSRCHHLNNAHGHVVMCGKYVKKEIFIHDCPVINSQKFECKHLKDCPIQRY